MGKSLRILFITLALGLGLWLAPHAVEAATIKFNPNPVTVGKGYTSEVQVVVSSSEPIYSVDVTVKYPTNIVVADDATTKGTNFPTTVFTPNRDNNTGTATFRLAATPPGYAGSNGVIGTISLRGRELGNGQLTVVSAKLITVDGGGDRDVYQSYTPGRIVVNTKQEPQFIEEGEGVIGPVPVVTSTTHPDPSKWYPERTVTFTWEGGDQYSWVFDQEPETIPPPVANTSAGGATVSGVADGTWYIHVRAAKNNNWGATTTFRVRVDGSPPPGFSLDFEPEVDGPTSALPLISFEADGEMSGINHYELSLNDGEFVTVRSPYQLPQIEPGSHKITVKAIDNAGNETTAEATINLVPLSPVPAIESPEGGATFAIGEDNIISGTAPPGSSVQLFADGRFVLAVDADENGKFEIKLSTELVPGEYEFTVRAVLPGHLYSEFSNAIKVTITPGGGGINIGGFIVPIWVTMILYVVLVLLLLAGLGYLFYRWRKARKEQKLAMQKLELMTEADPESEAPEDAKPIDTGVGQEAE